MQKIAYALIASAMLTSTAFANERNYAAPSSCANFSGFTAGALLGYGSGNARTTSYPTINGVASGRNIADISLNGMNGGIIVGYGKNINRTKVYLGLEADYIFDGARGRLTSPVTPAAPVPVAAGADISIKRQDSIDVNGRIGLVWGNALPHLLVGWANSKIRASNFNTRYINKRRNGLNVGAGVDFKLTHHVVAGARYVFTTFSKTGNGALTFLDGSTEVTSANNRVLRSSLLDNKFQVKIAYQF